jgi:hypothetical protein
MMMEKKKGKGADLYTPGDILLNFRAKPPHDNICIIAEKADQPLEQKLDSQGIQTQRFS